MMSSAFDEPIRILCVDDEPNVLRSLRRLFLDEDYEILSASSAEEGLELLREADTVQVVLSDFRMPGMNGVEFLREVQAICPQCVRIILSGYADATAVVSAINEGQVYRFIPKPWDDHELLVSIGNALEKYFLEKHNARLMAEMRQMNENLERMVEERTLMLRVQNRALKVSQSIFDALPAAVVGLDGEGTVVCGNQAGRELFTPAGEEFLGRCADEVLPAQLVRFAGMLLPDQGPCCVAMELEGGSYRACGRRFSDPGQEGVVLFVEELRDCATSKHLAGKCSKEGEFR